MRYSPNRRSDRHRRRVTAVRPSVVEPLEDRRLMTGVASGQGVTGDLTTATQKDRYTFAATAGGAIEASAGGGYYGQGLKVELDLYSPSGHC